MLANNSPMTTDNAVVLCIRKLEPIVAIQGPHLGFDLLPNFKRKTVEEKHLIKPVHVF